MILYNDDDVDDNNDDDNDDNGDNNDAMMMMMMIGMVSPGSVVVQVLRFQENSIRELNKIVPVNAGTKHILNHIHLSLL